MRRGRSTRPMRRTTGRSPSASSFRAIPKTSSQPSPPHNVPFAAPFGDVPMPRRFHRASVTTRWVSYTRPTPRLLLAARLHRPRRPARGTAGRSSLHGTSSAWRRFPRRRSTRTLPGRGNIAAAIVAALRFVSGNRGRACGLCGSQSARSERKTQPNRREWT